jgi:hypothetical protein
MESTLTSPHGAVGGVLSAPRHTNKRLSIDSFDSCDTDTISLDNVSLTSTNCDEQIAIDGETSVPIDLYESLLAAAENRVGQHRRVKCDDINRSDGSISDSGSSTRSGESSTSSERLVLTTAALH